MSTVVQEVLEAWRSAERLLDELPPLHPDHETLRLMIASLRADYRRLTERSGPTLHTLDASRTTIKRAQAAIAAARERIERAGSGDPAPSPARDGSPLTE
jgi:hypothetical protein